MTKDLLLNSGEEAMVKDGLDGDVVEVGLYHDNTDDLDEESITDDITSEPDNDNYARQDTLLNADFDGSNWGVENGDELVFDFSDTTEQTDVDCAFVLLDGELIANPSLSQRREIGSVDTLDISTTDLEIRVD